MTTASVPARKSAAPKTAQAAPSTRTRRGDEATPVAKTKLASAFAKKTAHAATPTMYPSAAKGTPIAVDDSARTIAP